MLDITKKQIEQDCRSPVKESDEMIEILNWCLSKFYRDRKHTTGQEICHSLTYEEIIGTLVEARELIKVQNELLLRLGLQGETKNSGTITPA